jgi:hypothetical protein
VKGSSVIPTFQLNNQIIFNNVCLQLDRGSRTVVAHLPRQPKVEGSGPSANGIEKENGRKSSLKV